jgi:mono/diheme cytochrome c family protein
MFTANRLAAFLFSFLFLPGYSLAAGQADAGKNLAVQLCATCHLVTEDQKSASTDVPTFSFIAAKYGQEIDYLAGFLADPHPPMPNFSLTRREIRDLLAYIKSLK